MHKSSWTTKKLTLILLIGSISCIAIGALAQTPNPVPSSPSGPVSAMAQELWPKGSSGCGSASLTLKIDNGVVAVSPAGTASDFGNTRITTNQRGMNLTVGKSGCLIRLHIEAVVDAEPDKLRR